MKQSGGLLVFVFCAKLSIPTEIDSIGKRLEVQQLTIFSVNLRHISADNTMQIIHRTEQVN